ncbi:MAG: metal-dependent transcriptional regulator [Anaerolineales bacterium]|nr:metal-dependent transcriptional regulator [Anaerolineales bacterium]
MYNPLTALIFGTAAIVIIAVLFWPEHGFIPRWQRTRRLTQRVLSEDALKHIYKWEIQGRRPTLESIAGALNINTNTAANLVTHMQTDGLIKVEGDDMHLTSEGRDAALHIIRAHRLWERYLAEETGYTEEVWHGQAEEFEHTLTPDAADALAAQLNFPTHDPHGDPIPTLHSDVVVHAGEPLTRTAIDMPARIVHIEDEPDIVYAQLVAEGLHPGQIVRVTESTNQRVRFWTNGNEHVLAPMVAANVAVMPLTSFDEETLDESEGYVRLSCVEMGTTAVVTGLSTACRGSERRRFLDLGITRGTNITPEMRSPGGDPTAYRIRGALIALRESQAHQIKVKLENKQL